MRSQSREYLAKFLDSHKDIKNVLDVGSFSTANGAHIKDILTTRNIEYTGVDMRDGDNVDVVINGHQLLVKFNEESFDMVICFDTFEHDNKWWLTLEQMIKVLKKGGWLMIGAPSRYCPEHNHPGDYYRFMPQVTEVWFEGMENIETVIDRNGDMEDEVYGWGQKKMY